MRPKGRLPELAKPIQGEAGVSAVNGMRPYVDSNNMATAEPYKLIFTTTRVIGAPMAQAGPTVEPSFQLSDDWVKHATFDAEIGKIKEVSIKHGSLWEKSKYYLTIKAGMMHSTAIRFAAEDYEGVKGVVSASPCGQKLKLG